MHASRCDHNICCSVLALVWRHSTGGSLRGLVFLLASVLSLDDYPALQALAISLDNPWCEGLPQLSRAKGLLGHAAPSPQQSASAPGRCRANPAPESSAWAATASATTAASRG